MLNFEVEFGISIILQMGKHNFVTIADLSKEDLLYLIQMAHEFEQHPDRELLKGKVIATLFYEPSTRTRLRCESFECFKRRNIKRHHSHGKQLR